MRTRLALMLLLTTGACFGSTSNTVTTGEPACLEGLAVRVQFQTCLSSSCDTLQSAVCTVEVVGDEARITGSAEIKSAGNSCTDDCGFVRATCEGNFGDATTFRFGDVVRGISELEPCTF